MNETGDAPHAARAPEIDCIDFLRLVDTLLDVDDTQWDATMVRHLRGCPPCRVFLEQLIDLRHLLRTSDGDTVDPDDPRIAALLAAVTTSRKDSDTDEHHPGRLDT
ncbi:hypothetical protein [Rhodococcus sp. HNM0569]|uniref:hypothetical protein n=1 Tax=Rhodococcus sp. HNM0569 TaxID=2716340 RepID=UPI00146E0D28|nr:hypothetical protein [Rhodococcus sp. HNM0569]NLU82513.1 hypothetical protein [Rhodococcus sp. HNM0569]